MHMFGYRFIKAPPTTYLIQYRAGRVVRQGAGLSLFFFAPVTSLVAVPLSGTDVPFIFEEVTADFQTVTVQGQVLYQITEPLKIAQVMDFTINPRTGAHLSEDPEKLQQRILNQTKVLLRRELGGLKLAEALRGAEGVVTSVQRSLAASEELAAMGVRVLGLSVLAVKPTPDTARALEAETRENLLRRADEAIYARRNAAVEQERAIKENELNTEISVENKKRQIREAQMDAERAVQERQHELQRLAMESRIQLEQKNKEFVALSSENARTEADVRSYAAASMMKALEGVDARKLQALAVAGMEPSQLVAMALQEIAGRADKIGELNLAPDLLRELMAKQKP